MITFEAPRAGREDGFTMVELLVSMGIFAILMVIITGAMLSGFSTIRSMTVASELQTDQQNAAEWISKLIRFADNPYDATVTVPAIEQASASATGVPTLTWYTFGQAGASERVPYKVTLTQVPYSPTATLPGIRTTVQEERVTSTGLEAVGTPKTRVLVPATKAQTPMLALEYTAVPKSPDTCTLYSASLDSTGLWCRIVPANNAALTSAQITALAAIRFTITGNQSVSSVSQTVVMGNQR
jgi:prepilin-type N-terminal cleavage/methylation domain-containing protein